jgi:trk system potassium uptake protein TrkH
MLRDAWLRVGRTLSMPRPEAVVLASFAGAILVGTFILSLPISHRHGVDFADALFTATSAVCVTGLVVVDTGTDFTLLGQVVILILIELGGLGVMTFAAIAFEMLGKRLSLSGQEAMTSALVHESMAQGFRFHFRRMLQLILLIEAIGASLLFAGMLPDFGIAHAAYSAIFHSVSAFCNAGFSLYEDSLIGLRTNWIVISTVGLLITIGGIGHPVLFDIWTTAKSSKGTKTPVWTRFTVHTRITLITTVCLLFFGFIFLLLIGNSRGELDAATALFQSVTARTAGFNILP